MTRRIGQVRKVSGAAALVGMVVVGLAAAPSAQAAIAASASPDGERVYFSIEDSLLALDTDASADLYGRSGALELASQGPNGFNGPFDIEPPFIAVDGGAAFFATAEPLLAIDTDSEVDVYRRLGDTTLHFSQGGAFNGPHDAELIGATEDGAEALVATRDRLSGRDTDDAIDIYRRAAGTTTFVSRGANSFNGPFDAELAGYEPTGAFRVAFRTAEQALAEDSDGAVDLYLRLGRTTELVSTGPQGDDGAFDVLGPVAMDRDATIAFFRTAEPLVTQDADSSIDLYRRTTGPLGETTLVSQGPAGFNGAHDASAGRVSADGSRVYFTTAEQLVEADADAAVDVYERAGGETALVSQGPGGFNGGFDASLERITGDGAGAFFTTAEPLAGTDTDSSVDIYERSQGRTRLVSQGPGGFNGDFAPSLEAVSEDGASAFLTTAEQLVEADTDAAVDVYERAGDETALVSQGPVGFNGAHHASFEDVARGEAYFSTAEPLLASDADASPDLYGRAGSTTRLVSTPKPDPAAPSLTVSPASPANLNRPILHGAAEAGATVRVYANGACAGTPVAAGSAAEFASPGIPVTVPDDSTTEFTATAGDANNNEGACSAPQAFVEDSTAEAPALVLTDPGSPSSANAVRVRGRAEAGARVRLYANPECAGEPLGEGTTEQFAGPGIAITVAPDSTTLIHGAIADVAGNRSACSPEPLRYVEDSTAPQTGKKGLGRRTTDRTPTIRLASNEPDVTFTCRVDGAPPAVCPARFELPRLERGSHRLRAKATDAAGNTDSTAVRARFRVVRPG